MITAFIGLGSNLADPIRQVQQAIQSLKELPQTRLHQISSLYRSQAMGMVNQPDFINAVAEIHTHLVAEVLLDHLQAIERQQGRKADTHWQSRSLDLDILLYGQEVIQTARLQVPHIGLKEREFVLYPLAEIAPELILPSGEGLPLLLLNCHGKKITRVAL